MTFNRIKPVFLILPMLLVGVFAIASEPYSENFDQTYPISASGRLSVENVNGNVQITVWDRNEVRVQAVKEGETREALDRVKIEVSNTASSIKVNTRYPENNFGWHGHNDRVSVVYTISVPKGISLDKIDLVNGDLTVTGVAGDVNIDLVNGELKASGMAGNCKLETVNGRIDIELDKLDARQRVEIDSVNGTVEVRVPAGASADVEAETVNGSISNDFGLTVTKHEHVGRDMNGTIGGGGALVKIETVNGTIRLLKK